MRSIRVIYEMRAEGLYPCRHPGCRGYGRIADHTYGIICETHSAEPRHQYGDVKITLADLRAIEYDPE
jgi:hypothetical protein